MKRNLIFLLVFCLTLSVAHAQSTTEKVTGTYVGQYKWEGGHAVITVKKNHHFIIKKYDWSGKCKEMKKGDWSFEDDKIVLKDHSGNSTILEKHKGPWTNNAMAEKEGWYIYGSGAYSFDGYFYQGLSMKEFKKMRSANGC